MSPNDSPKAPRVNLVLLVLVSAVLVFEVVRIVDYLRDRRPEVSTPSLSTVAPASPAPREFPESLTYLDRELVLDMPVHRPPREPTRPVAGDLLAPRLLDDRTEMTDYLAAFPESQYRVAEVPGIGRFYIDELPDLIKQWLDRGEVWEPEIVRIIGQFALPGTTVIDAGAHIGTHTVTLCRAVGETGRVYAFEPQKKVYRELVRNLELNGCDNAVALRFAVGDAPGVIEMDSASERNEAGTAVGEGGDRAELRTLDSFGFDRVSFVKIDVEGFENPVLEGARRMIAREKPVVVVEVQGGQSFDNAPADVRGRMVATIQLLESMGYYVLRVSKHDYLGLPLAEPTG